MENGRTMISFVFPFEIIWHMVGDCKVCVCVSVCVCDLKGDSLSFWFHLLKNSMENFREIALRVCLCICIQFINKQRTYAMDC